MERGAALAQKRVSVDDESYLRLLEGAQKLRRFDGEPARFWTEYLRNLMTLSEAEQGIIAVGDDRGDASWRVLALEPRSVVDQGKQLLAGIAPLAGRALEKGMARWEQDGGELVALRLETGAAPEACLLALKAGAGQSFTNETVRRLGLLADVPATYQLGRIATEAKTRVEHFAGVLDLMVLINAEKRFLAAAMTFCNELAARHRGDRVSLGWLDRGYVRLQAVSHVDRFERKAEAAQMLEAAMEEALDQDSEIVLPPAGGAAAPIRRDSLAFARANDIADLCSLPLRVDDQAVAVCTCERNSGPFGETELRLLRLSCDQAARRLADLKRSDRWAGARAASAARELLQKALGCEHTGAKLAGIAATALLAVLIFGRVPHRPKAQAILRAETVTYLTAPFDGHLESVKVRVGDGVSRGDELLSLDRAELLLREAELLAEKSRTLSELEKARASNALADMRIAQANLEQSQARHDLVLYRLSQAAITAPYDGVVVEGDLMERVGSPVRQGDTLFKLARLDAMYAELEVGETDIQYVHAGVGGDIAFASRPQDRYPVRVTRAEAVAVPKEEGNVFVVRAQLAGATESWWRPGMTGVARLEAGSRSLFWILTHRTLDFLRLRLWW